LTPAEESLSGNLKVMKAIINKEPNIYYVVNQFENPLNPDTHYLQTGPEIWRGLKGKIGAFVAGIGSGGTLQGVGKFLKMIPVSKSWPLSLKTALHYWAGNQAFTKFKGLAMVSCQTYWTSI
jgi:Pyridoxal-phosphate dependent enzyme